MNKDCHTLHLQVGLLNTYFVKIACLYHLPYIVCLILLARLMVRSDGIHAQRPFVEVPIIEIAVTIHQVTPQNITTTHLNTLTLTTTFTLDN